jgi:hypothetical protein
MFHLPRVALPLLFVLGLGACSGTEVGRVCLLGRIDGGTDTSNVVGSPALECASRTCLHWQNKSPDLCTAECETPEDCDKVDESPCVGGFACEIPVVVGPFCCKRMCICKDYLPPALDGGLVEPAACDTNNPLNICCNLPGRRGNAEYPNCN